MIRKAKITDYNFIRKCRTSLFEHEREYDPSKFRKSLFFDVAAFLHLMLDYTVMIIHDGVEDVGYITYKIIHVKETDVLVNKKYMYIGELYVDKTKRKSKYASQAIVSLIDAARKLGCEDVRVCCYNQNTDASQFYKVCEFTPQHTTFIRSLL